MRAYRAGTVAIVNAVGTGVADDKAVYHHVPEMIRFYLGEEPILANVPTYLLADPEQRRARARPARPARRQARRPVRRQGRVHRPERERRGDRAPGRRDPAPARSAGSRRSSCTCRPARPRRRTGALVARHVDLRPFAVFGEDIHIVPGGLTRVALREGSMIVNSSQGGGSKDTWVLEDDAEPAQRGRDPRRVAAARAARPAPGRRVVRPAPATAAAGLNARPHRPRAVLDRPPALARRAHRAHARRRLPRRRAGPPRRPRRAAVVGRAAGDHGRGAAGPAGRRATRSSSGSRSTARTRPRSRAASRRRARAPGPCATCSPPRCGRRSTRSTSACCGATTPPRCAPGRTRSTRT